MLGKFEINRCHFVDCIDAMRKIPSGSIDLCLTDPPYNIGIGESCPRVASRRKNLKHDVYYEDTLTGSEYVEFSKKWFNEAKRICKRLIFTPGENNLAMWYAIETPVGVLYHYKNNGNSPGTISRLIVTDPILVYGTWEKMQCFRKNAYAIPLTTKTSDPFLATLVHPCPKSYELWEALLYDYMHPIYGDLTIPNVILDPFVGSGTTPELCEANGINWIGFEKNATYAVDIEKRIARGKERAARSTRQTIF